MRHQTYQYICIFAFGALTGGLVVAMALDRSPKKSQPSSQNTNSASNELIVYRIQIRILTAEYAKSFVCSSMTIDPDSIEVDHLHNHLIVRHRSLHTILLIKSLLRIIDGDTGTLKVYRAKNRSVDYLIGRLQGKETELVYLFGDAAQQTIRIRGPVEYLDTVTEMLAALDVP